LISFRLPRGGGYGLWELCPSHLLICPATTRPSQRGGAKQADDGVHGLDVPGRGRRVAAERDGVQRVGLASDVRPRRGCRAALDRAVGADLSALRALARASVEREGEREPGSELARALRRHGERPRVRQALDPAELEQSIGERRPERSGEMGATLGPVRALPRERPAPPAERGSSRARARSTASSRSQSSRRRTRARSSRAATTT
jgi:hypothetical protein